MLKEVGSFLIIYQYAILTYFLILSGVYSGILVYAFHYMRNSEKSRIDGITLKKLMFNSNARPVSVLIPAYNEEVNILQTVSSTINCEHPEFEVIVINDGSTDATLQTLQVALELVMSSKPIQKVLQYEKIRDVYISRKYPNVIVVDKENGGKADALNAGMDVSTYPFVCAIDADSILEPDALLRIGNQFLMDKELVASGGSVRVLNGCEVKDGRVVRIRAPHSIIECVQIAEYLRGFMAGRVTWQSMHSLLIISGAFGIFRKDLLQKIGGYRKTVGEDMDLVVRLHRYCILNKIKYRVAFDPEPVCWTQVPSDFLSLLRQRNRWQRGLVDSMWHSRGMFFNPRYGKIGFVAFPYFFFIETLGPLVEITGYFSLAIFWILGWVSIEFLILFFIFAVLWGALLNISAVLLDNLISRRYEKSSDVAWVAAYSALEFFGYRQIVDIERLFGTLFAWRTHWGHAKRKAMSKSDLTDEEKVTH
ncbi:glycosyltransferase family 2 protein [Acidithiobacillus ferrianus]|uniref:glycosyltransferase family 2 protein n=1 Tax=Acidithiobacillus ferrianus TaxID=2678518 RepID=UPI0034E61397